VAGIEAGETTVIFKNDYEIWREHPRFGYRRLYLYLRKEMTVNHKKVQRVYRQLGLNVKRTRRKHLRRTLRPRPVLTSRHYLARTIEWKIDLIHIQSGNPTQNGGMESFNGKLRDECLNTSWFWN
jgi:hypothetical protein